LNQFIIAIGHKYIEDYGPTKFWSALHRARREGYWAESETITLPIKRKRKFGKSYFYENVPQTVYKLEHELTEVRKALKEIGTEGPISPSIAKLTQRSDQLESIISERAETKSEAEMLEAAEKWFNSLK
jgi:hypothetical protein